ncbi:MAG TPA: guanylate kinase [Candidatus Berkiella sp.]|nr:guanylate kinase [Candidatus Berkiella sp.]
MNLSGTLYIISAPSGGGKTSLVNAMLAQLSNITVSISHTTRVPRVGEIEGKNYFFVDEATFRHHQETGIFLEHAKVFNNWYGTSKTWVLEQLAQGIDVVLEIDWQGARVVKEQMDCTSIFILPPSREVLLKRLVNRSQDSQAIIDVRMKQASQEISHHTEYDYVVVNDDFELALHDLKSIIIANRLRVMKQKVRYETLLNSLVVKEG